MIGSSNKTKGCVMQLFMMVATVVFLASCKGSHGSSSNESDGQELRFAYAENISISKHPGYHEVTVRNPWDTVKTLHKYILVPRDTPLPNNLPQATVVKVPVGNALVYSTVHAGLIDELGASDAIGGVCNAQYIRTPIIQQRIKSGEVADCGNSMSPDLEKILKLRPDVIMLSPFENNDRYAKAGDLSIPIIECADYMETSPLGRAEWIKFYGLLTGKEELAEKIFSEAESNYLKLKALATKAQKKPKVVSDQQYGQIWNVPGGLSTTGILIEDAGGINPFASFRKSGSIPLAPEKVLSMAHDADVWLIKFNQDKDKSLEELAGDAPVNSQFKPFKEKTVYGCNTRYARFYEETPFHPDRILSDYIKILHPELMQDVKLNYFHLLK